MAAAQGSLHVDIQTNFNGFLNVHIIFDITVTVSDDLSRLTATVTNNRTTWSPGASTSWGFINFSGLAWSGNQFMQVGTIHGRPENWNAVYDEMRNLSGGVIPNDVIWGVYCSDAASHQPQGIIQSRSTWTKALSPSDFTNGQLNNLELVRYVSRWYLNGSPQITSSADFTINIDDIVWDYFPWAVRHSGWRSCNDGGGVWKRVGAAWSERKNATHGSGNTVFVRKNGSWTPCPEL